jgi:hypothetical protein
VGANSNIQTFKPSTPVKIGNVSKSSPKLNVWVHNKNSS